MQKQQKLQEIDLNYEQLWQLLNNQLVPLWSEGKRQIPLVEINDNVLKSLAFVRRCGSLRIGLEQIQVMLQAEENGLAQTKKSRPDENTSEANLIKKISRIIILSNDGSERFYRHCETILNRYSYRVLGIKLNVPSSILGNVFYGRADKDVKALFVNRKDAVLRVLSSFL
jgi:hypothetical protein